MSLIPQLSSASLWRGAQPSPQFGVKARSSGYPQLDALLPGGGWPEGALSELLLEQPGIGELRLLLPLLRQLGAQRRMVIWIAPPHLPYAPALARAGLVLELMRWVLPRDQQEAAWTAEQCLRSGSCGAVLFWPRQPGFTLLRRLQLAAEQGRCSGFLFRPASAASAASDTSPAALRLRLQPVEETLQLELLKCRGRRPGARLQLEL